MGTSHLVIRTIVFAHVVIISLKMDAFGVVNEVWSYRLLNVNIHFYQLNKVN